MKHTIDLPHQSFMLAVRQLMGWPLIRPVNDSLAFCASRPADFETGVELARLSDAMRKDVICSGWSSTTARKPETFTVVRRDLLQVDVVDDCVPYMANKRARLMLASGRSGYVFGIGSRGMLERLPGAPTELARKNAIALRQIRAVAATLDDVVLDNNQYVPFGGDWVDTASPRETLVSFN